MKTLLKIIKSLIFKLAIAAVLILVVIWKFEEVTEVSSDKHKTKYQNTSWSVPDSLIISKIKTNKRI